MLDVSAYENDDEGNENRICFWLRLDNWHLCDAAMLMIDIDPDTAQQHKFTFFGLKTFKGEDYSSAEDHYETVPFWNQELAIYQKKYDDMHRILFNPEIEYDTPSNWLNRASAKKVDIPWLSFAIRRGFYERENNCKNSSEVEKPLSQRTENNYLRLIMSLANGIKDFNPKKPYEAAQLIINETGIEISQQTISDYISKAHELESKNRE